MRSCFFCTVCLCSAFFIQIGVTCAFYILSMKYPLFFCLKQIYGPEKYFYQKQNELLIWEHWTVLFCPWFYWNEHLTVYGLSADIEPDYLRSWPCWICKPTRKYLRFNDGATCLLLFCACLNLHKFAQTCSEN